MVCPPRNGRKSEKFSIRRCGKSRMTAKDLSLQPAVMIKLCSRKSNHFCLRSTAPEILWKRPRLSKLQMLFGLKQENSKRESVSGITRYSNKSAKAEWERFILPGTKD